MSLHCVRGCTRRGRHLSDCEDPDTCKGCEPRMVGEGYVCDLCADRTRAALAELPQLWADLAERPRLAGVSTAVDGEGDLPGLLIGGQAVTLRSAIRAHLVTWAEILNDKHRLPAPDEVAVARSTRSIVQYHSGLARQSRDAAALLAMPAVGPLQPSPAGHQALKDQSAEHAKKAAASRHDRETGLDLIRALTEHLGRHLARLLHDADDSTVVVDDITEVHWAARKAANPARGANLRILCSCGTRVSVDPDEIMTCSGCGNYGVLNWWVQHEAPTHAEPMTLSELHAWLIRQGVLIHERKLRDWADKELITAVSGGEGRRRRYDPQAVLIVARMPPARRNTLPSKKDVA